MRLFNTLTRKQHDLTPLHDSEVSLYTCGLTVYSQPHIGNWVAYIYWDTLVRALRAEGFQVKHVQNITDVGHLTSDEDAGEDKMLQSALKEGKTAWEVAEKYSDIADYEAYELLRLNRPTHMPKATEYIEQQIKFVEELEEKGYTYIIDDGVYFDTSKLGDYGKLARLDIDGLRFGARVEDTGKKNPTDFALWKFSPKNQKRDMEWESKWGVGFPGWHLECSVMARELLGDQIDIHTGGIDHIAVHHTNEIAQTEAITKKPFAQFWLHANHIKVNNTKMSKSLGNIFTLGDVQQEGYDVMAFKLMVLSKHYRTEGNFTWEILKASQNRLNNWKAMFSRTWQSDVLMSEHLDISNELLSKLQSDLDTPAVLAEIDTYFDAVDRDNSIPNRATLGFIEEVLGIYIKNEDISDEQKSIISKRNAARESKDWPMSDELRDQLLAQGITLKDTPKGTIWFRA